MKPKRINLLHILFHGIAIYTIGSGCSFLYMASQTKAMRFIDNFKAKTGTTTNIDIQEWIRVITTVAYMVLIFFIVTFVVSLIIGIRKKLHWANSLLALILAVVIMQVMSRFVRISPNITWFFSNMFNFKATLSYVITGLFWTSIGTYFLFSKRVQRIISPKELKEDLLSFEFDETQSNQIRP